MRTIQEREGLLKRIAALKEKNKKKIDPWQLEMLDDVNDLRREE